MLKKINVFLKKIKNVCIRLFKHVKVVFCIFDNFTISKNKLLNLMLNSEICENNEINSILSGNIKVFNKNIYIEDFDKCWHKDPFSNVVYNKHFIYLKRPRTKDNVDIKSIWELSRLYFLLPLALSVQKDQNNLHISYLKKIILSFINNNKYPFGVNWINPMEVSIRSFNILLSYSVLYIYLSYSEKKIIEKYLYQSMKYIYIFKEDEGINNNHYLSNIMYLLIASEVFNDDRLIKFSMKEFEKEVKNQIYHDGTVFEASTYYHRLTTEIILYSLIFKTKIYISENKDFLDEFKRIFSNQLITKFYKMISVIRYCIKPDGTLPIIGDNDSGQVLRVHSKDIFEVKYILSICSFFLKRDIFINQNYVHHTLNCLIPYSKANNHIEIDNKKNINFVRLFKNSGWLSVRHNDITLMIVCGPNGQEGKGGHAHNDKTSFVASVGNINVILHGGTFCYTCNKIKRNFNRSNLSHNVLSLINNNTIEQNSLLNGDFVLFDNTKASFDKILNDASQINITCSHSGFEKITTVRHYRNFYFNKKTNILKITDTFYNNIKYINNIIVNEKCIDRVIIPKNTNVVDDEFKYSDVYYTEKQCRNFKIESNIYEVQL